MAELTQVVNGKYIGADKYTITDTSDGKKQITFSPDQVLEQGTPVGAEILNEIQKNGLYYLTGTHRVNGQESIYDCTLVGIDTFEFTQLNVLFKPNVTPTQAIVKLNISGQIYTLAEKLINANQLGLLLVNSEMKAYTWGTKIAIVNDLTTGGADKALSAEMGKQLDSDKVGGRGILPLFDGTFGDFDKKVKDGVYEVQSATFPLLGIDKTLAYEYGALIVKRNKTKGIILTYSSDGGINAGTLYKQTVSTAIYNFSNNPQKTFANDAFWAYELSDKSKIFYGITGAESYKFIQDSGSKTMGRCYFDKETGKPYKAKQTNSDVTVTDKFELITNLELSNKIPTMIQVGTIVIDTPLPNSSSKQVSFSRPFASKPKVIISSTAGQIGQNSSEGAYVDEVTTTGFTIRFNWEQTFVQNIDYIAIQL